MSREWLDWEMRRLQAMGGGEKVASSTHWMDQEIARAGRLESAPTSSPSPNWDGASWSGSAKNSTI